MEIKFEKKREKKNFFLKKNLLQLGVRSSLVLVDATDKGYVRMSSLVVLWARSIKNQKIELPKTRSSQSGNSRKHGVE